MAAGPVQRWLGSVAGDGWSMIAREGDLNSAGVKMSSLFHFHDSTRARQELGYQTRDVTESLDVAADWITSHHM